MKKFYLLFGIVCVIGIGFSSVSMTMAMEDSSTRFHIEQEEEVVNAYKSIDETFVNGRKVQLSSFSIFQDEENTMIPLRLIAEALGFAVDWHGDDQTIDLDDGAVKTTLEIGEDAYYKASSQAIGLTNTFSFGSAPIIRQDRTYVPTQLFDLLYSKPDVIRIENSTMYINTK